MKENKDERVKKLLREHSFKSPLSQIDDRMLSVDYSTPENADLENGSKNRFGLWFVAACVLLGIGFVIHRYSENYDSAPTTIIVPNSTESMMLFVSAENLDEDNATAILHEMKDFEIIRKTVGESIFHYTIEEIKEDGITLSTSSSLAAQFFSRKSLREQFDTAVQAETGAMREIAQTDVLSKQQFSRLEQFAFLGQESALRLMRDLADSTSQHAKEAKLSLDYFKELSSLEKIIVKIDNPKTLYRDRLIKGLANIRNPVSIMTLRKLIEDSNEDPSVRMLAVRVLSMFNDGHALNALQATLEQAELPDSLQNEIHKSKERILRHLSNSKGVKN